MLQTSRNLIAGEGVSTDKSIKGSGGLRNRRDYQAVSTRLDDW